jgi:RNA polymerase sigma-70 factor (ECF subfamily)
MAEREEPRVPDTRDHQRDTERRFAALDQAYYRPILAYAVRRAAPGEDAADIVADVFTTAWRRIGELPEPPADRLWLYGVAQRVLAGRRRSARRLGHLTARLRAESGTRPANQLAPDQLVPGQPGLRDTSTDRLLAALDHLPAGEREALQLILWEQLSHAEAAEVLGCSVNAVAIRVHRARTRLRHELSGTRPASTGPASTGPASTGPASTGPASTGPASTGAAPETSLTRARMDRS